MIGMVWFGAYKHALAKEGALHLEIIIYSKRIAGSGFANYFPLV